MFRIFTFYITPNGRLKCCDSREFRVKQDLSLNISKDSFHRIKPGTISRKFNQSNRLGPDISLKHLRAMSFPTVQDDIKTIALIMFPQEFKTSDNLFSRLSTIETQIDLVTVDIIGCQKFTFAMDILFGRYMRSFFTPRTSSITLNNQRAFFIKGEYPCFTGTFIQKLFNAFFSLQNEDLDLPSISEQTSKLVHLCINKFARFLYRYNLLSCGELGNSLAWGGSRW